MTHTHHWIIESPHGPKSMGRCKTCRETREFWNSIEGSMERRKNEYATKGLAGAIAANKKRGLTPLSPALVTRECANCGTPFSKMAHEFRTAEKRSLARGRDTGGKFCSRDCGVKWRKVNDPPPARLQYGGKREE